MRSYGFDGRGPTRGPFGQRLDGRTAATPKVVRRTTHRANRPWAPASAGSCEGYTAVRDPQRSWAERRSRFGGGSCERVTGPSRGPRRELEVPLKELQSLETLYQRDEGAAIPLPLPLSEMYGELRLPVHPSRPSILANFATTLDGVVSLGSPGAGSGGEIDGFERHGSDGDGALTGARGRRDRRGRNVPGLPEPPVDPRPYLSAPRRRLRRAPTRAWQDLEPDLGDRERDGRHRSRPTPVHLRRAGGAHPHDPRRCQAPRGSGSSPLGPTSVRPALRSDPCPQYHRQGAPGATGRNDPGRGRPPPHR